MSQNQFDLSDWVDELSACLLDLLTYERLLESEIVLLRQRSEVVLGLQGSVRHDSIGNIRERVSQYSLLALPDTLSDSRYRQDISQKLSTLQDVLLEHPDLERTAYTANDEWVVGLDLGVSRTSAHQMVFMLQGLVDFAVEHTPEETARALAEMMCKGETHDLTSYSIMLFHGLHVERRHDFEGGLSIISFEESRQYLSDSMMRSFLGMGTDAGRGPIGAVVSEVNWGPAFVPTGSDMEAEWPKRSETFRDDALLLIDLLAVTHGLPVESTGRHTTDVEQHVKHLVGQVPYTPRWIRDISGANTLNFDPSTTPAVSEDRLLECQQLLSRLRNDQGRMRLALSRLASSLSRSGRHAAADGIVDAAIALEVMYQVGPPEQTYRLAARTSYFLEESAESRIATSESIKGLYKARSSIVHGGTGDDGGVFEGGFEVARRTLTKLVLEGGPSSFTDWDELVIKGGAK